MAKKKVFRINKGVSKSPTKKRLLIVLGVLLLAVAVVTILELTNVTNLVGNKEATSGVIPSDNATETIDSNTTNSGNTTTQESNSEQTPEPQQEKNTAISGGADLLEPFGNFVSNHHPSLSNAASTAQQSVCNTTPGATCYIKFTQGSVVRELEKQTTNNSGVASWNWDVNKSGLTAGTWEVTAVAGNGSQEKTTKDALKLEVQP